jgi:hypothetical protein
MAGKFKPFLALLLALSFLCSHDGFVAAAPAKVERNAIAPTSRVVISPPIQHSKYEINPALQENPPPGSKPVDIARHHVENRLHFRRSEYKVLSSVTSSSGVTSIYLKQMFHKLEVVNGDMNINILYATIGFSEQDKVWTLTLMPP